MTRIATGKVRQAFAETMNRVAYVPERIVLHRRGKDLAALIPVEDLTLLEALEDRLDVQEAEKALAKSKARGEKPIQREKAKKKLGLKLPPDFPLQTT
jgi:PHD/YefM family antitoxin component YafN of YafNO toxin-antitoxin module